MRHTLVGIVAVALAAVLAGARSYAAIGQWAGELTAAQLAGLGLDRPRAPEAFTFRRVFASLDAAALDALVAAVIWTRTRSVEGQRVIAIDGKTIRGARTATQTAAHLVAAFDHATGTVRGSSRPRPGATRSPPSGRC